MNDDARWMREFLDENSREAFERLVRKYVHLVYSAALRQLNDPAAAEDTTQQTFIAFWKKARSLRHERALSAWLLVTARYYCMDMLRAQARRHRHEQTAAAMAKTVEQPPRNTEWGEFSLHLDAALASLTSQDRRAISLRYFEGQSIGEVAQVMGTSPEAAKQRVHRATLRMRKFFATRGVNVSATAIGPAIMAFAVHDAPPCVATSTLSALTAVSAASVSLKGAAVLMASAKTKIFATTAAVLLFGAAVAGWKLSSAPGRRVVIPSAKPDVNSPPGNWQEAFNAKYGLFSGQTVRLVEPPYGPERQAFWDSEQPQSQSFPIGNMAIYPDWDGQAAHCSALGPNGEVYTALRLCAHLKWYEIDPSCMAYHVRGDWVARKNATQEEILNAMAVIVSQKAGHPVRFVHRLARRETIVIRGSFTPTENLKRGVVSLVRNSAASQLPVQHTDFSEFLNMIEDLTQKKVFNESDCSPKKPIAWRYEVLSPDQINHLVQTVSSQTSLKFDIEPREIMVWALESEPPPTTSRATQQLDIAEK